MNNINSLYQIRNKRTRMHKVLTVVFQIIHLLFGLDFGFLKPKSLNNKWALYMFTFLKCLIVSVPSINGIYLHEGSFKTVWFSVNLLIYVTCVLILSLQKADRTFFNLYMELREIDLKLKVDDSVYNLELKLLLSLLLCFIHRTLFTLGFCLFTDRCLQPYWASFVFYCVLLCIEFCHVCYTYIFLSANCRLKQLVLALSASDSSYTPLQYIYKSLVDITEKYKNAYGPLYSVALVLTIPGVLMSWFFALQNFTLANPLGASSECAVLLETFILTMIPALAADTLTTQVEKIKVILHDMRLQEREKDQTENIIRFIDYVEARGFRFHVYKVIPLNSDLLGMVLYFCVTYIIVIVQFTHIV